MHLSEGVLHSSTLIGGAILASFGVMQGLRKMKSEQFILTALFSAAFFVASTIHIPVGIGSVHLILNGMAGLFLGWSLFPAFLIALSLQALFFSFGGLAVLGVNLCIMAFPALAAFYLLRPLLRIESSPRQKMLVGALSGILGVGGAALMAALVLTFDGGKDYFDLIWLLFISHLPVFVIDSIISALVISLLAKMSPEIFRQN